MTVAASTDAGVLVAITGHGPTPPEGGPYYHRREITRPPPLLHLTGKRDPACLSGSFSSTNSRCPRGRSFPEEKSPPPSPQHTSLLGRRMDLYRIFSCCLSTFLFPLPTNCSHLLRQSFWEESSSFLFFFFLVHDS
ncbi:hypothetical protein AVEN_27808-1 [Araneus ventricosus]|uniref:Uncharacterized protein n=1 Tax=Araneus ventricosus TaxID=182803 RepID=A0A4Y2EKX8_ARAVE|nr:hypothetical protein AVEN_27808-1 [Araneus ventricosus]